MAESNPAESPLDAAAVAAGQEATQAFKQLGNETRLAILLALWDAYDPFDPEDALPFSALYDRVEVADSGNFTYHLDKLVGHFVEEQEGGYALREAGLSLVQAVIAGTGLEDGTFDPALIDLMCYRCDEPVEISYADEHLYLRCTACEGKFGPQFGQDLPAGTLGARPFPPAGLWRRVAEEVFAASQVASWSNLDRFVRGVCPTCTGTVEATVQICETHEMAPEGVCPSCGTTDEVRVRYVCSVCKDSGSYPADAAVYAHPTVVAFCHDQGFDLSYHADDPDACTRVHRHHRERDSTPVSTDPVRVRATVPGSDATLQLILDGDLNVIDETRTDG